MIDIWMLWLEYKWYMTLIITIIPILYQQKVHEEFIQLYPNHYLIWSTLKQVTYNMIRGSDTDVLFSDCVISSKHWCIDSVVCIKLVA